MFDFDGSLTEPCKCFICERSFDDGEIAAAPGFNYEPDYPSRLYGAKLICDNCIKALAEHRGWVPGVDVASIRASFQGALSTLEAERDAAQAKLDEGVAGLVKLLDAKRAETKPRTRAKSTTQGMTLEH